MITFSEFMQKGGHVYELIKLESVPNKLQMDYFTRNKNVRDSKALCLRCDGTGNEFFSMFKKCSVCLGKGVN